MRSYAAAPAPAAARVLKVEFKFTPFVGDPAVQDEVTTVASTAAVFFDGIPGVTRQINVELAAVLFDAREIVPLIWLPVESLGSVLRQGVNPVRI